MSRQTNGLHSMATQVSDGPLGGCAEVVTAAEFSAAAMPTVFWGTMRDAWDRALAGFKVFSESVLKLG